jgi:hypothetical protein
VAVPSCIPPKVETPCWPTFRAELAYGLRTRPHEDLGVLVYLVPLAVRHTRQVRRDEAENGRSHYGMLFAVRNHQSLIET